MQPAPPAATPSNPSPGAAPPPESGLGRRGLLAALALSACRTSALTPSGQRLVSLSPNTTETLFALGAGPSVVGRSRYCDHPPEVKALPQVGGYTDPNLEAILALRPSLVTGARGPAGPGLVERLAARGVATYFPPTESLAEIFSMIEGLGQRAGRGGPAGALLGGLRARQQRMAAALDRLPRPRALLLFGITPVVAAGPGSFADEMLRLAGATNALAGASALAASAYPTLALEQVIALDADVILDAAIMEHPGREALGPAWSAVRAVREGRVRALDDESVLRPGPRVLDGVAALARALHPGVELP